MTWRSVRKWWRIIGSGVFVVFTIWSVWAYQPHGVPSSAFRSSSSVKVEDRDEAIYFRASSGQSGMALLFFPGGLVDPRAYVPLVRSIADQGVSGAVVKIPRRGAFVDGSAGEVRARARQVANNMSNAKFVIAGHSKGALFACEFVRAHPDKAGALVLIGSTHPRRIDLSSLTIPVTKISASGDGLASPERVRASAHNLPPDTRWVMVRGGNHSQFGSYGFQPGDRFASISRADQQAIVVRELLLSLREIEKGEPARPSSTPSL